MTANLNRKLHEILPCIKALTVRVDILVKNVEKFDERLDHLEQGWAIIPHEEPDLEKLSKPRAAR